MSNRSPIEALRQGATVVVPNNRAQQHWAGIALASSGVLPAENLFSFTGFIAHLIKQQPQAFLLQIINEVQSLLLLTQVVPSSLADHPESLQSFLQAYALLGRWRIPLVKLKHYSLNHRQQFFLASMVRFEQLLAKNSCLTPEQALAFLLTHKEWEGLASAYYFYGFDDFYPLQQALLDHLQAQGCSVSYDRHDLAPPHYQKKEFEHSDWELTEALTWLISQPKSARAALVVLDMDKNFRNIVEKAIAHIDPELERLPLEQVLEQVSFSSGTSLAEQPLVDEVLRLLALPEATGPAAFLNPAVFVSSMRLRAFGQKTFFLWQQRLIHALSQAQWCQLFDLSSTEYQTRAMFLEVLERMGTCAGWIERLTYAQWVQSLRLVCQTTIFQAQSLQDKKLILGLLEAAALDLDAVWIIGADHTRLPQSLNPHPLLPTELQEMYSFPHAHAQRELTYLTKILKRLAQATTFILSYAQADQRQHFKKAAFIDGLFPGSYELGAVENAEHYSESWSYASLPTATPCAPQRLSVAQLNQFYQCPFRGFVRLLAGAERQTVTQLPLDPARHGQLVHYFLQQRLKNLDPQQAFARYAPHWPQSLKDSETLRLMNLSNQLAIELPESMHKAYVEYPIQWSCHGWLIEGRVDLWDKTTQTVFDIKSKSFAPSGWYNHEPDDLQGPLYVLALKATHLGLIRMQGEDVIINNEDITEYCDSWSRHIKTILDRFAEGNFEPQPRELALCHQCRFKKACRHELT